MATLAPVSFDLNWKSILAIGGLGVIAYLLLRQGVKDVGKVAGSAAQAIASVNEGTPYEGYGVGGTLGNATNTIIGFGLLDDLGGWIGRSIYDLTHKEYKP